VVFGPKADLQPDYPATWRQFRTWFPDEQSCIAYLEHLRWPTGFRCPGCAGEKGLAVARRMLGLLWLCS